MKKTVTGFIVKFGGMVASIAFAVAAFSSVDAASSVVFHQPKMPAALKNLK